MAGRVWSWLAIGLLFALAAQATHKVLRNPSVSGSDCNVAVVLLGGYSIQHSQRTLKDLSAQVDVCHFHLVLVTYNNSLYQSELSAFHRHLLARPTTTLVIFESFVPLLNEHNAAFKVVVSLITTAVQAYFACSRSWIQPRPRLWPS